jgi:hypothetical protein
VHRTDGQKLILLAAQQKIGTPTRRFILTCRVKDHTGSQLISISDDQVAQLLSHPTGELFDMQRSGQGTRVEAVYNKAFFTECYPELAGQDGGVLVLLAAFFFLLFALGRVLQAKPVAKRHTR